MLKCIKFYGKNDYQNFNVQISLNNLKNEKEKILNLLYEHLKDIIEDKTLGIEQLYIEDSLLEYGNNLISVNIENLDNSTSESLLKFLKYYEKIFNEIEDIRKNNYR